jgi:predicted MPP superfamily phosphohydrolase
MWLLAAAFMIGCKTNDDPGDNLLRGESKTFYDVNHAQAARRVHSIMYNRTDTLYTVERFKLVHISDPHLSGWSIANKATHPGNLIESVTFANHSELKINAMVETGDHISSTSAKAARDNMASFFHFLYMDNYIPTFSCFGNHDANIDMKENYVTAAELATFSEQGNYSGKKGLPGKSYYYADVPSPQGGVIRIIALNMLDQPLNEYNTLHYVIYSQEQIDWLADVALKEDMTPRHSVVILTHFPFQESVWTGKAKVHESYLCDGDFVHGCKPVTEIIEAFRTRSVINNTYPNKLFPMKERIKTGFDFTASTGEFVCYLGGHAHCFALFDIRNTGSADLPPQKMILCTNQAPSETGGVYNKVVRAENSATSNSFNIYAIDTKEKKVYVTFFGAYVPDNDPDFPSTMEFPYL